MRSVISISLAARERLRGRHAVAAKAVTAHAGSLCRLHAATSRRAEIVARQESRVADAATKVVTVVEGARVMGIDVAAVVLGLTNAEVRRLCKEAS
jgi:hypothetical protein